MNQETDQHEYHAIRDWLRRYLQGNGWTTTREAPTTPPTPDIRTDVEAFKARYAEPPRETSAADLRPLVEAIREQAETWRTLHTARGERAQEHGNNHTLTAQVRAHPGEVQRWQGDRHQDHGQGMER